jgi:hypothetical protein
MCNAFHPYDEDFYSYSQGYGSASAAWKPQWLEKFEACICKYAHHGMQDSKSIEKLLFW